MKLSPQHLSLGLSRGFTLAASASTTPALCINCKTDWHGERNSIKTKPTLTNSRHCISQSGVAILCFSAATDYLELLAEAISDSKLSCWRGIAINWLAAAAARRRRRKTLKASEIPLLTGTGPVTNAASGLLISLEMRLK